MHKPILPQSKLHGIDSRAVVSASSERRGGDGLIAVDPTNRQQNEVAASTIFRFPFGITVDATGQIMVAYPERVQGLGTVLRVTRNPAGVRET
jgi:hypothetical protein